VVDSLLDEFKEDFANRLTKLRIKKGSSARNMSLSLGKDGSYIGKIERKNFLPSVTEFYYICEFLGTTPRDFLNTDIVYPGIIGGILNCLNMLDEDQLSNIEGILQAMVKTQK